MSVLSENLDNLEYRDLYSDIDVHYQYVQVYTVIGTEAQYVKEVHSAYNDRMISLNPCLNVRVDKISLEDAIRFELSHHFNTYGIALQEIPQSENRAENIAKMYVAIMPMGRVENNPVTSAVVTVWQKISNS